MSIGSLCDIDVELLASAGVKLVVLDLDNTLFPYGEWVLLPCVKKKLEQLRGRFDVVALSNTIPMRAQVASLILGIPVISMAMKPIPFALWKVITARGWCPECTVIIGDQIFTDGLLGLLSGVRVILIPPLSPRDAPHTKLFRRLEASPLAKIVVRKLRTW